MLWNMLFLGRIYANDLYCDAIRRKATWKVNSKNQTMWKHWDKLYLTLISFSDLNVNLYLVSLFQIRNHNISWIVSKNDERVAIVLVKTFKVNEIAIA